MLSVLINTHLLMAAREFGVERYFFASSACVYAADKQTENVIAPLKEADAYPAMPEDGYGWEKLFSERMCRHFREDFGVQTRVARYHNVYGPHGTWTGGREKAPAAICRKVIEAKLAGRHEIEIWGSGKQTRSFMYIDDCLKGTQMIMASDVDGAAQSRQRRIGDHQPAGRHRRRDRRHQAEAALRPERTERRERPQQRQHADHASVSAGRRAYPCAKAWRRHIAGSTTRWWRSKPRDSRGGDGAPRADTVKALAKQVLPAVRVAEPVEREKRDRVPGAGSEIHGNRRLQRRAEGRLLLSPDVGLGASIHGRAVESSERAQRDHLRSRTDEERIRPVSCRGTWRSSGHPAVRGAAPDRLWPWLYGGRRVDPVHDDSAHSSPRGTSKSGSGLSTYYCSLAAAQNAREGSPVAITCIEPNPYDKLYEIPGIQVIAKQVQDVDLSLFQELQQGDVLFIDSSHVLKIDGDVPFLYLEVLPR